MRARRVSAIAAAAVLILTGCSTVPTTGPVNTGLGNLAQAEQFVQFDPEGPVPGATQEEIVRGFVNAASSVTDDYSVARSFLTPEYASQWDPTSGIMIDESSRPFETDGDEVAMLSVTQVARVDGFGVLDIEPSRRSTQLRFELERSGNEWRIRSAPNGIVLDRNTFVAVWSPYPVYFPSGSEFVPEYRWFPSRTSLPNRLVASLLRGPSPRMEGRVTTAFAQGTSLVSGGVTVVDDFAEVRVSRTLGTVDAEHRITMEKQLSYTLAGVGTLKSFTLGFDNAVFATGSIEPYESRGATVREPLVTVGGVTGKLREDGSLAKVPLSDTIARFDSLTVAMHPDLSQAAMLTLDGVVHANEARAALVDSRDQLLPPSIDPLDYVWSASTVAGEPVRVTSGTEDDAAVRSTDLVLPDIGTHRVVAARVSPDGSRLALLVPSAEGAEIHITVIQRDSTGRPVGLGAQTQVLAWSTGSPMDLDWIDDTRVAMLTQITGSGKVTIGNLTSFPVERGSAPGADEISGTTAPGLMRLRSRDGELLRPQGTSGWEVVRADVGLLPKWG